MTLRELCCYARSIGLRSIPLDLLEDIQAMQGDRLSAQPPRSVQGMDVRVVQRLSEQRQQEADRAD